MKSNHNYSKVFITIQLSERANQLLTESSKRSGRKKSPEATLRLEHSLEKYISIADINHAVANNDI